MKLLREHERLGGGEVSWLHESKERERFLPCRGLKRSLPKALDLGGC